MELSLVIPAYNEENEIKETVRKAETFLVEHFKEYELILVDDGSTDSTKAVLNSIENNNIKVISYDKNRGKGYAVKKGMLSSKGRYVFFTDADLPYDLYNIVKGIRILKENSADIVIGSRRLNKGVHNQPYPLYRKFMSNVFSLYTNTFLNIGIYDTQCGFKGFTKKAAASVFKLTTINNFGFDVELLYIAKKKNLSIQLLPVNLSHREGSKVNVMNDSLKMIRDVWMIKANDNKGRY